jgi:23S rRNA (cytosine1962-C5)-methyltransferase
VLRLDTAALTPFIPWITRAVLSVTGAHGVCARTRDGLQVLAGSAPPEELVVSEHGLRFHADLGVGQKTGLFLDHRENRRRLEPWCQGCSVLNVFSYTGGFSLYAARGGATRVVSVDSAPEAMARARDNVALNGMDPAGFDFVVDDAFHALERFAQQRETFDVVITDPPSFARNRTQRKRALRAYERLHTMALQVLAPAGLYAAGSCTTQVDGEAFRDGIATAAARSRRRLQIVL